MKIYYFEKGWELTEKHGKKCLAKKENNIKIKDFSGSGVSHQVDEYYLKSEVDELLKQYLNFLEQAIENNKKIYNITSEIAKRIEI